MTPEHLVDSVKLYDFYVNGFEDGKYTHRARVHLPATLPYGIDLSPATHSAPTILDLLNAENIDPKDTDVAALEEHLFNNPDPYDLDETERVDEALQSLPFVTRSSIRFDVADFVKLHDPDLKALITKVDTTGPGASVPTQKASEPAKTVGKPGEWSIDNFLSAA